jgi:Dinucleotide-utilizing enzymes involved in molybdopterin and thiamine biosynthesis family 2
MQEHFVQPEGEEIHPLELNINKAKELASVMLANSFPYTYFLCSKRNENSNEIIVFETEVEIGQRSVHDIRKIERIAVEFFHQDNRFPEVLALRTDFPLVPHLNLRNQDIPRSLCLYDIDYNEFKLRWTPIGFIARIREWLAQTAKGSLHAIDQPLEPFFVSSNHIIIDNEVLTSDLGSTSVLMGVTRRDDEYKFLECHPLSQQSETLPFIGLILKGEPQEHGIIHKQPSSIKDLHGILSSANIDLLSTLHSTLRQWQTNKPHVGIYDAMLLLLIVLPKTREAGGTVEMTDVWAFICFDSILKIGIELGVWQLMNGSPGLLLEPNTSSGEEIKLAIAKPIVSFSKDLACSLSGIVKNDTRIVLIGTGALGSQVHINLARMGFGNWTLIDNDYLFPHNLARHGLHTNFVGANKALALQRYVSSMMNDEQSVQAFNKDILISSSEEGIKRELDQADVILDISTSIAVARHLALDVSSSGRRLSMFMNPTGYDVVVLAEDVDRKTTLDCIEMQYYLRLIEEVEYHEHLRLSEKFRYSNSCRDVSNTIPQDLVALQAAICSRALQQISKENEGSIQIWRTDPVTYGVQHRRYPLNDMKNFQVGEWIVCTVQRFIDKIYQLRGEKLPNETGGVLIGSYDLQRKIVYVMDTLSSPPDSKEWPTYYVRGFQGLHKKIDKIKRITADGMEYVGEWHSHPNGIGARPSGDDRKAFALLSSYMSLEGKPALMMIAGDCQEYSWFLEPIK